MVEITAAAGFHLRQIMPFKLHEPTFRRYKRHPITPEKQQHTIVTLTSTFHENILYDLFTGYLIILAIKPQE